jgi:hypothetical protein
MPLNAYSGPFDGCGVAAQIGLYDTGIGQDFIGFANGDNGSRFHGNETITKCTDHGHVVFDDDERGAEVCLHSTK